jgi:hypothetical protein
VLLKMRVVLPQSRQDEFHASNSIIAPPFSAQGDDAAFNESLFS